MNLVDLEGELKILKAGKVDKKWVDGVYVWEDSFCEMLDVDGEVMINGFGHFPSDILRKIDAHGYYHSLCLHASGKEAEIKELEDEIEIIKGEF